MPVPTSIADLSSTIASNSPAGPDAIGTSLDDYLRASFGILRQMVGQGTDITAASTITLPNDGQSFLITGATTITGIADSWVGRAVVFRFATTLQLTYNVASFILPGSANISTAAGDFALFVQTAAGVWRCAFYGRADGSALISNSFSGGTVPNATTFSSGVTFNGDITANGRTITPTELGYVDGLSDYAQTQLNGKQSTITGAATTIAGADLTANRALIANSSGKVAVSAVTETELGTLSGIGSTAISTQLAAKQATITGGATTIDTENLTASRALASDSSGKVAVSAVTATELALLSGKTALGAGPVQFTPVNWASGAAIGITGIPSTARKITLAWRDVSTNGGGPYTLHVQLGDSGGYENTGYTTISGATTGFQVSDLVSPSGTEHGVMTLTNVTGNEWFATWVSDNTTFLVGSGYKSLSGTLDRIQILCSGTLDDGTLSGTYE